MEEDHTQEGCLFGFMLQRRLGVLTREVVPWILGLCTPPNVLVNH